MTSPLVLVLSAGLSACPAPSPAVRLHDTPRFAHMDARGAPATPEVSEAPEAVSEELEALYRAGIRFAEFLAAADRRRELWDRNWGEGRVPDELAARARALKGTWRLLAVAEDWCSDSASTIPFIARLSELVPGIELRIVDSEAGREIMEAYRTPDGRAATPTVLVLDENFDEAGCWVERPGELQEWALQARPDLADREFLSRKMAWYADDGGVSTIRDIVELLEGAAAGAPICPAR